MSNNDENNDMTKGGDGNSMTAVTSMLSASTLDDDNDSDDEIASLSSTSSTTADAPITPGTMTTKTQTLVYTKEELVAIQKVQQTLKEQYNIGVDRIGLKYIALTTIISKNRIDEACTKIKKFLKALDTIGITSITDEQLSSWSGITSSEYFNVYQLCGVDIHGRDSLWIYPSKETLPDKYNTTQDEQRKAVWAGILYHFAVHANPMTLRNGLYVFCIDISHQPPSQSKDMDTQSQKINQSYPMRPQNILIAGASTTKQFVINALIKVASLFTKVKILKRIKFVTVEQTKDFFHHDSSYPKYLENGIGRDNMIMEKEEEEFIQNNNVMEWTKQRIDSFPVPQLPSQ